MLSRKSKPQDSRFKRMRIYYDSSPENVDAIAITPSRSEAELLLRIEKVCLHADLFFVVHQEPVSTPTGWMCGGELKLIEGYGED